LARFPVERCDFYVEIPTLHIHVEAFFSSVKSLLDLLAQLLTTQRLVNCDLNGYHKAGTKPGGRVLKVLEGNVPSGNKEQAGRMHAFLTEQGGAWINNAIAARDALTHPQLGTPQLMFTMILEERSGELILKEIRTPSVGEEPIDAYARRTLIKMKDFATEYLEVVRSR
jgi:hypothetical protein